MLQLAPIVSIIINSFWNPNTKQFTLANYGVIFTLTKNSYLNTSIPRTILNSFLFAISSAVLATILAIITIVALGKKAKSRLSASYELISYLPLAVSSLTISLGILRSFVFIPFFQKNPWLFIVISHTLLGYPFITRALLNGLNTIGDELDESARTLGAGLFFKLRKVYFPLLTPSLLAGLAFALGLSFGEFTIANFFYRFDSSIATLTVALYKFRDFRLFGESSAVGVLLLITSYLIFFLIELFGGREKTSKKI
jgi:ABC-type Fe3+ transport system permease subunit